MPPTFTMGPSLAMPTSYAVACVSARPSVTSLHQAVVPAIFSGPFHEAVRGVTAVDSCSGRPESQNIMSLSALAIPVTSLPCTVGDRAVQSLTLHTSSQAEPCDDTIKSLKELKLLIQLQSILQQLKCQRVYEDFLAGKIVDAENLRSLLETLEALGGLIFIDWPGSQCCREQFCDKAALHLKRLNSRSHLVFKEYCGTGGEENYTYAALMDTIIEVMDSNYWSSFWENCHSLSSSHGLRSTSGSSSDDSSICCRISAGEKRVVSSPGEPLSLITAVGGANCEKFDDAMPCYQSSPRHKCQEQLSAAERDYIPLQGITPQSLAEAEIDGGWSCCGEGNVDGSINETEDITPVLFPREAVIPEPFHPDGRQTLKAFFHSYEYYFNATYFGGQRACTQVLGKFLLGEMKDAFDALGGTQLKYSDMKQSLCEWYQSQRINQACIRKVEFQKAKMRDEETFLLYFMRLEGIACQAYPEDAQKCAQKLGKKVLKTVPKWFVASVERNEEVKIMIGSNKGVTWSDLKKLANFHDRKKKKLSLECHDVTEGRSCLPESECDQSVVDQIVLPRQKQRVFYGTKNKRKKSSPVTCNICNRRGHASISCWHKIGACTLCGSSGHLKEKCSRLSESIETSFCSDHWDNHSPLVQHQLCQESVDPLVEEPLPLQQDQGQLNCMAL